MQISQVEEAVRITENIANAIKNISMVDVFIAPSFNALYSVGKSISNTNLKLASQNIHYLEQGAFTGETSILSCINAGCEYVILGHSERRRIFGETGENINQKVLKTLEKGLKAVLCIGETAKERAEGRVKEVNQSQLAGSLKGVSQTQIEKIIIAYEPVWAINNKFLNPDIEIKPATPHQASEAHAMVRDWFRQEYGDSIANSIQIIYGGSMNQKNAEELLKIDDIDGGLIGGASLTAKTFLPIIRSAEKLSKQDPEYEWDSNTLRFRK
ncbi:MAG: triose-phosphate isomerase [Candidatus Heimdallarchaeota archaeon]|nr:MAG: triose-phosphate isomerase [Candidatus Heimdallarchaeota archaeon]